MCFYQPESLPGYSAIFRHPKDELNYCYYLIPCGKEGHCGDVTEADLPRLHNDAIKNDPYISRALGPNAKIERMRAAPLRLGSQGVPKSYDDHLLIIGDAAGHIDPLARSHCLPSRPAASAPLPAFTASAPPPCTERFGAQCLYPPTPKRTPPVDGRYGARADT